MEICRVTAPKSHSQSRVIRNTQEVKVDLSHAALMTSCNPPCRCVIAWQFITDAPTWDLPLGTGLGSLHRAPRSRPGTGVWTQSPTSSPPSPRLPPSLPPQIPSDQICKRPLLSEATGVPPADPRKAFLTGCCPPSGCRHLGTLRQGGRPSQHSSAARGDASPPYASAWRWMICCTWWGCAEDLSCVGSNKLNTVCIYLFITSTWFSSKNRVKR